MSLTTQSKPLPVNILVLHQGSWPQVISDLHAPASITSVAPGQSSLLNPRSSGIIQGNHVSSLSSTASGKAHIPRSPSTHPSLSEGDISIPPQTSPLLKVTGERQVTSMHTAQKGPLCLQAPLARLGGKKKAENLSKVRYHVCKTPGFLEKGTEASR